MAAQWIEPLTGSLEQKKRYKHHTVRIEALTKAIDAATGGNETGTDV